jgi:hypothetical protein
MAVHGYDNLPVALRTASDGGSVALGVMIDGGFFPFHWMPIGGFEDDLATIQQDEGKFVGAPQGGQGGS